MNHSFGDPMTSKPHRFRRLRRMLALAVPILVPLTAVRAQTPQTAPATITLEEAIQLAREHSPTYRQAQNGLRSVALNEQNAFRDMLPSLNWNVSLDGATPRQTMGVEIVLFDGLSTINRYRAAQRGAIRGEAEFYASELQVQAQIKREFYGLISAMGQIELEQQLLESAQQRLERTREMYRFPTSGTTRDQVLGVQLEVAQREQALEQARNNARSQAIALRTAIGLEENIIFEPVGELPAVFDPAALDADALIAAAVQSSPRAVQAQAQLEQQELQLSATRGRWWPRITLNSSSARHWDGSGVDDVIDFVNPFEQDFRLGFGITLPVFQGWGFDVSRQVAQQEIGYDNAVESVRQARLNIERDVRQAIIGVENAYTNVRIAEDRAELARERVRISEDRLEQGQTVSFIEIENAVNQLANAERALVNARLGFTNAVIQLEQVVGDEVRP